jgi:transformer-2 protein
MLDPHTRESRGFGFIRMATGADADRAMSEISGTDIDGRIVTIEKVSMNDSINFSVFTNSNP